MICSIVLAAGRSGRMGTQKLLLPLGGKPIISRIVDELLQSAVHQTVIVTGGDGGEIKEALRGRAVAFVQNPDPKGDMLSSVRCGLRMLPDASAGVLVVLGDQPGVTHDLIDELIGAFHKTNRGIIVPIHGGSRGHPLLFASRFREEVLGLYDGVGLTGLLRSHAREVFDVAVPTWAMLEDMDTPVDYERLKASHEETEHDDVSVALKLE